MKRVFQRPRYVFLAAIVALTTFVGIVCASAVPLFVQIVSDSSSGLTERLTFGTELLLGSFFEFTLVGFFYALTTSLLIGIAASLLVFYFRMYRAAPTSAAAASGIVGALGALFGFGCAACGSVFLVSLAGTLGGIGFLTALPFGGEELGYAGIFLLGVSIFLLSRAVNKPPVCPI
jgi:hypothetical protein